MSAQPHWLNQPRKPKGTPIGGEFDNMAGGGAATSLGGFDAASASFPDLDREVEFDCPFAIGADGGVGPKPDGVYAPEVGIEVDGDGSFVDGGDAQLRDQLAAQGWEPVAGFSGQHGVGGDNAFMAASETLSGRMADHVRSNPGVYVIVEPSVRNADGEDPDDSGSGMWVLARKAEPDAAAPGPDGPASVWVDGSLHSPKDQVYGLGGPWEHHPRRGFARKEYCSVGQGGDTRYVAGTVWQADARTRGPDGEPVEPGWHWTMGLDGSDSASRRPGGVERVGLAESARVYTTREGAQKAADRAATKMSAADIWDAMPPAARRPPSMYDAAELLNTAAYQDYHAQSRDYAADQAAKIEARLAQARRRLDDARRRGDPYPDDGTVASLTEDLAYTRGVEDAQRDIVAATARTNPNDWVAWADGRIRAEEDAPRDEPAASKAYAANLRAFRDDVVRDIDFRGKENARAEAADGS